jgi:TolB-like protein/Flp pilus assembly protein TadD
MRSRASPRSPAPPTAGDLLDSWKEIARYLNRDVRTIQRWERTKGLPVHRLPGGDKPAVYALRHEVDAWRLRERDIHPIPAAGASRVPERAEVPSVAVLPFANLSDDKANEYFSDGLADEILTALTRLEGVRVTARTSSFALRDARLDVREIGARLGVKAVLEGSVQRAGGRLRISAQLVDAGTGFHLWGEHFDRQAEDVFAVQDEISQAIAGALQARLVPRTRARPTQNLEAYNEWLKGRYFQQYEDAGSYRKARSCFECAIALDPSFPHPYLGLAGLFRAETHLGSLRPRDAAAREIPAIARALELDDSIGEAHALSGAYRAWMDFDWKGAEAHFARALALTPAAVEVHVLRALNVLVPTGRLDEAEAELTRAIGLDPLSPLLYCDYGQVLIWARHFTRAEAVIEAAAQLRPEYPLGQWYRGVALVFQGRLEEGLPWMQQAHRKLGPSPGMMGSIGMVLARLGRAHEARSILAELQQAQAARYVTPIASAWIHLGLGEIDAAFEWLGRAVEERDPHILALPSKPVYDPLRSDPRFTDLLRKMRLA